MAKLTFVLVAAAAAACLAAAQTGQPWTTTGAGVTTTTGAMATTTAAGGGTGAPATTSGVTCAAAPLSLYGNAAAACTATEKCTQTYCDCVYGSGTASASTTEFGVCKASSGSLSAVSNCTELDGCLASFFKCVHRAAQESDACTALGAIQSAVARLNGAVSNFDGSDFESSCKAMGCTLATAAGATCGPQTNGSLVCRVPLFKRARMTLSGQWGSIVSDSTKLALLITKLTDALTNLLGLPVEIDEDDVSVATSRRAAGDLIVQFTVAAEDIPSSTSFDEKVGVIRSQASAGNTTWLSSVITDVYVANGGSASDVAVGSISDTTPSVSLTSTAAATTTATTAAAGSSTTAGATDAPGTTASSSTTGATVSGSGAVRSVVGAFAAAAVVAVLALCA